MISMSHFEYGFFRELEKIASNIPPELRERSEKLKNKLGRRDRGDRMMAKLRNGMIDWISEHGELLPLKTEKNKDFAFTPEARRKRAERLVRSSKPDLEKTVSRTVRQVTRRLNPRKPADVLRDREPVKPMPIPEPAEVVSAQNPGWSTGKKLLAGGLGVAGAYGLYRMLNSNRDKEREKTAASDQPAPAKETKYPFNMSGKTFRSIGLGLAATPLVAMGAGKLMSLHAVHKNKKLLEEKNPNGVASHPLFEQQFNSLKRFSPKVAADPLAAAHVLHKMQHSSQGLLDILKDVHQLHTEDTERRIESRDLVGETGERLLGGLG